MRNLTENRIIRFIRDNGGYFGIIGAISMTLSALISFLLILSVNPSFNIVSYAVSDLVSGPVISSIIYSVGLIIASFCQIPTYISLMNYFNNKESYVFLFKITALSSFLSIISHNILSVVPSERNFLLVFLIHGIAAGIHYVSGTISLILIGIIEFLNIKVSKILVIISFITGTLYGIVWIRYLLSLIVGIEELYMYYSIQWFALAGVILWSLFHGIFLLKAKKRALDNAKIKEISL
ncbi:MAG: hypothetical protein KGD74_07605 [Candidatus Lokiarchaeota archaeon]|nr:hypothetical protein [Candidatus Lokiarchaeota archaeon]